MTHLLNSEGDVSLLQRLLHILIGNNLNSPFGHPFVFFPSVFVCFVRAEVSPVMYSNQLAQLYLPFKTEYQRHCTEWMASGNHKTTATG